MMLNKYFGQNKDETDETKKLTNLKKIKGEF